MPLVPLLDSVAKTLHLHTREIYTREIYCLEP